MDRFFSHRDVSLSDRYAMMVGAELQDVIPCGRPNQEVMYLANEESEAKSL